MSRITRTLELTGGRKGQTVVLRGYPFVNGRLVLTDEGERVARAIHVLHIHYQTEVVDGERHPEANPDRTPVPAVVGDVEPGRQGPAALSAEDGSGHGQRPGADPSGLVPGRNGYSGSGIVEALTFLDPADDSHWTPSGKPLVRAVSDIMRKTVTRADIELAVPRFKRP